MVISMLKIRRPLGRLIFNMGIAIPGKTVFLIETAPRFRDAVEQKTKSTHYKYLPKYEVLVSEIVAYGNINWHSMRFCADVVDI